MSAIIRWTQEFLNVQMERHYDTGAVPQPACFLRITANTSELYLVSQSIGPDADAPTDGSNLKYAPVPLVMDWGECDHGFSLFDVRDHVPNMTITCANGFVGYNPAEPVGEEYFLQPTLSDWLTKLTLGGNEGTGMPWASVFFEFPLDLKTGGNQAFDRRITLFKGVVHDWDVSEDGKVVTIRLTEDRVYDRPTPYTMDKKKHRYLPPEMAGAAYPMAYGVFGGQETLRPYITIGSGYGPFDPDFGWFPAQLRLCPAHQMAQNVAKSQGGLYYHYNHGFCVGLANTNSSIERSPELLQLGWWAVFSDEGRVKAMFNNASSANGMFYQYLAVDDDAGMVDMRNSQQFMNREDYHAVAMIFPVKEYDGLNNGGDNRTLPGMTNAAHLHSRGRMIDGDGHSFFIDNSTTAGQRKLIWELGAEADLGAILSIKLIVWYQRTVGTGNVTWDAEVDYADGGGATVTGATVVDNPSGQYSRVSFDFSTLRDFAAQVENWQFVMRDSGSEGEGMRVTLKWDKATDNVLRIVQVNMLVEFNPGQRFLENAIWTASREATGRRYSPAAGGRLVKKGGVHVWEYAVRVLENVDNAQVRRAGYGGCGFHAESALPGDPIFPNQPGTWRNIIHNPAEVVRHIMYHWGGGWRTDWGTPKPIEHNDFLNEDDPQSFVAVKDYLNLMVQNACGDPNETFVSAISFSNYGSTRALVGAIEQAFPGLSIYRLPSHNTFQSAQPYRSTFACAFPYVDQPVNYRRPIHLDSDVVSMNWSLTGRDALVNDIEISYAYQSTTESYSRQMVFNAHEDDPIEETGWPVNTRVDGSDEAQTNDAELASTIRPIMDQSYLNYGTQKLRLDLPFVYRWQEALAMRNHILKWNAFQRLRLQMVCNMSIGDLVPGDVFQLDERADDFIEQVFPLIQLPGIDLSGRRKGWNGRTFLVERVRYRVGAGHETLIAITALFNGRIGDY